MRGLNVSKSLTQKSFSQRLLKPIRLAGKSRFITWTLTSFGFLPRPDKPKPDQALPMAVANEPVAAQPIEALSGTTAGAVPESSQPQTMLLLEAEAPHAAELERSLQTPLQTPLASPLESLPAAPPAIPFQVLPDGGAIVKPQPGKFSEGVTVFEGESYPYRLYVPSRPQMPSTPAASIAAQAAEAPLAPPPLPLIVLLHGCKQDSLDFAQGTAMNALADEYQCIVLYPEQIPKANSGRCWNWFDTRHQQRDAGEPGMIAALTRQVLATKHGGGRKADPQRVYIAGLSAGGAMAALMADLYPDVFAAVGVHSGLPAGAAQSMMSAFGAMQRGAKGQATTALPTIVFHGTGDKTVHPDNGGHVSDAALTALRASGLALVKSSSKPGRSKRRPLTTSTEKTVYRSANGPSYIEHWRVDQGPHAWSGGNAEGSYTDPSGPSASAAMMAFFLQHRRP
jgi:poly(hydroxyalkanoate) depolymerase family esterase